MAVEEAVPNPHVCPRGGVTQLPLTDPTLKALDVEVKAEGLNDHGRPFAQRVAATGAQLLTAHRPVWRWRHVGWACGG